MAEYRCVCGSGAGLTHISGCNTPQGCKQCCKGKGGIKDNMDRFADNPSDPRSFGFNNKFDGRIRGGLKTPQAFDTRNSIVGREFNIFDRNERKNNFVKSGSMNTSQNQGFNVNPNRSNGRTTRIAKKHPLDVLRQKRVMGATVYDPVTKTWKIDDLRPRGWDEVGKIACWGKCKVRRRWWMGGTQVSCNCNKTNDGCKCDGCLGGATC